MDQFLTGVTFLALLAYAQRVQQGRFPASLVVLSWLATCFSAVPVALVAYEIATEHLTWLLLALCWGWLLALELLRRRVQQLAGPSLR